MIAAIRREVKMLGFSKRFVCATRDICNEFNHVNAPVFRHSFSLKSKPDKAEILITGLGFYDLFVNGEKVTKGFLAPYISNPDDIIYYDLYDLTDKLTEGENVIGAVLGNGMNDPMTYTWEFKDAIYTSSPRMALSFRAECGDEITEFDATEFVCTESPIIFDNLRYGVHYDARLEEDGWCCAGFDDGAWRPVLKAESPRGYAKLCEAEPIKVVEELAPVAFYRGELAAYELRDAEKKIYEGVPSLPVERTGGYIYDFGKNTAGVFRFKIKNAKPGQVISFQCCEYINKEGKASYANIWFFPDGYVQRDVYICRGDKDEEIFVPMFVYHGCRYIYLHGVTEEQATADALTYLVMNSDLKKRAYFNCSNETANKLWQAVQNSDLSNFYYFPTDCPHREKNGWTGDAAASCEHMIMSYSVENSYREWLNNIRASQKEWGELPGIVPTAGWGFSWGNGPAWDRVLFDLPYVCYIYRGNTDIIRENRHAMMGYLEYISNKRDEKGLIACGLGDWVPVGEPGAHNYQPKLAFTDSVMVYDMCVKAEKMFLAIGNTLCASFAKQLGAEIKAAVRENLIDLDTVTVSCQSQSAQAMAIYHGIFEPAEKSEAARRLVDIIHMSDDNMEGGYLGLRVVFHVLSAFGESELAYRMIMKDDFPSYAYYINRGMTTLPEAFIKDLERCGSLNHHFLGDTNHWFMRHVVGINVNPMGDDANNVVIKPNFVSDLTFAEGGYETPAGYVRVRWERDGEKVRIDVKCDEGVRCEVRLPSGYMLGAEDYWRTYRERGNCTLTAIPRYNHFSD